MVITTRALLRDQIESVEMDIEAIDLRVASIESDGDSEKDDPAQEIGELRTVLRQYEVLLAVLRAAAENVKEGRAAVTTARS
jgi:hypothetical protein